MSYKRYVCSPWCSSKYSRMHLVYYVAIPRVYGKLECTPIKHKMHHTCSCEPKCTCKCSSCKQECTSVVSANQRYTCTVYANHDAHSSRLMSCVYTACIFTSSIFRAHAGYFMCIFRNVSSRVVATCVFNQV